MVKADLKTGMRVRTRNNKIWLVVVDFLFFGRMDILFAGEEGRWMDGNSYDENLLMKRRISEISTGYDIMEVYTTDGRDVLHVNFINLSKRYSIWKRKEYTDEQKEIFKALKVLGYNYVARDADNDIYTYQQIPCKKTEYHNWNDNYDSFELSNGNEKAFDFVKWEDTEPFKIPEV